MSSAAPHLDLTDARVLRCFRLKRGEKGGWGRWFRRAGVAEPPPLPSAEGRDERIGSLVVYSVTVAAVVGRGERGEDGEWIRVTAPAELIIFVLHRVHVVRLDLTTDSHRAGKDFMGHHGARFYGPTHG